MSASPVKAEAVNNMEVDNTNNAQPEGGAKLSKRQRKRMRSKSKVEGLAAAGIKKAPPAPKAAKVKDTTPKNDSKTPVEKKQVRKEKVRKSVPSTPEGRATAIRQKVEWYFSRNGMLTNKDLLLEMAKNENGFARLSIVAQYAALKKMTKDFDEILAAIKTSKKLEIKAESPDGPLVKSRIDHLRALTTPPPVVERGPLNLDNFDSVHPCNKAVATMLNSYKENDPVSAEDSKFLTQLLQKTQPKWKVKEEDIQGFKVGRNEEKKQKPLCFILMKKDGTEEVLETMRHVNYILTQRAKKGIQKTNAFVANCMVKVFGLSVKEWDKPQGMAQRKRIRDLFKRFGIVGYVNLKDGADKGQVFIRFRKAKSATKAIKTRPRLTLDGYELTVKPMTPEEEKTWYDKMFAQPDEYKAEKRPREENEGQAKETSKNKRKMRRNKGKGGDDKVNDKVKQEGREAAKQKGKEQAKAAEKAKETEKEQPPSKKRKAQE